MWEFFRGWRRKIGVVTLVIAYMFAAGWVRSLFIEDTLVFTDGSQHQTLSSLYGKVYWDSKIEWTFDPGWFTWFTTDLRVSTLLAASLASWETGESYCIPYWSIVLPLALLSLWLLLFKSRQSNQKKITEPTAIEGAVS